MRLSRSGAFSCSAIPVRRPGRLPLVISALLTQFFRVCDVQAVCAVVDVTDLQREEF